MIKSLLLKSNNPLTTFEPELFPNLRTGLFSIMAILAFSQNSIGQTVDLSTYVRVGRYDLPEPTRTAHPTNNLLAQEASGVTYNWDTNTLLLLETELHLLLRCH